jgi:hypothetical protein
LNSDVRSYADVERRKSMPGRRGINEEEPGAEGVKVAEMDGVEEEQGIDLREEVRDQRDGTGNTRKELSWIWLTTQIPTDDGADPNNEMLCREWGRSRARAHRAKEQVRFVREEMRRTLETLDWQAEEWRRKSNLRALAEDSKAKPGREIQEGLRAYAIKQARIQHGLKVQFVKLWQTPLSSYEPREDEEDNRLRMILGLAVGGDEDEMGEDVEDLKESENEEMEDGNDAGDGCGADVEWELGEDEDFGLV